MQACRRLLHGHIQVLAIILVFRTCFLSSARRDNRGDLACRVTACCAIGGFSERVIVAVALQLASQCDTLAVATSHRSVRRVMFFVCGSAWTYSVGRNEVKS
ncbi:hypothetical protein CSUI_009920 [Cystoisospora suis]|uniref:Uncharacterized protein n=1 Tax=Cystoisospora suis TaxID=483139 RepID=A0A2C6KIP8_9APIC|nr:hypothetical protein CSUI_009920 [Cystoisospora suis]